MGFNIKNFYDPLSNKIVGIITVIATSSVGVVFLLMRPVENELTTSTGFGVMDLEFAWTVTEIETIFSAWGESLIAKELGVTLLDMLFLIVYSIALAGATLLLTRLVFKGSIANIGYYFTLVPFFAAVFDVIENLNLILMLSSPTAFPEFAPFLASVSAVIKFGLLIITIIFWFIGLIHRLIIR